MARKRGGRGSLPAGTASSNDSTIFYGVSLGKTPSVHFCASTFINPVLYVEYENVSRRPEPAEVVGPNDSVADVRVSNAEAAPAGNGRWN